MGAKPRKRESFEQMLTGGHPNSLGQTVDVVDIVLRTPRRLRDLFDTYRSHDDVVRLRVSSAIKRVTKAQPALVLPFVDRMLDEVAAIEQASTQWTLAELFLLLSEQMSALQLRRAVAVVKRNLEREQDWIVLNHSMQTLYQWSKSDAKLRTWVRPQLSRLSSDTRGSVATRARRLLESLPQ